MTIALKALNLLQDDTREGPKNFITEFKNLIVVLK